MHLKNLKKYLEIEFILNGFFDRFGYCITHCIRKSGRETLPNPGCCSAPYYKEYDLNHPAFALLKQEREKRYGKPEYFKNVKRISPCEYHTLNGCLLKTHKSPVCLGFMCKKSIYFLRDAYNIYKYDYLGINYALEWILTGDLPETDFKSFKSDCMNMLKKIST